MKYINKRKIEYKYYRELKMKKEKKKEQVYIFLSL